MEEIWRKMALMTVWQKAISAAFILRSCNPDDFRVRKMELIAKKFE